MPSQFLPSTFDPTKPVAIIAGKGTYPILTVEALRSAGVPVRLVAFKDETDLELVGSFSEGESVCLKVGQIGKLLKALKQMEVAYTIMAGQITPKRLFRGMHPDLKAIALLKKLKTRNAETIFTAIVSEIEALGIQQLDARVFLDNQLADEGLMTGGKLKVARHHIEHGFSMAREIARLDIGQGVVVHKGTVLAVEAFEGTDAMLRRAGTFNAREPLFIKTTKVNQDFRFDVPVFGLKTLEVMQENNIRFAALEARNTIILEKEEVIKKAQRSKVQIFGY